LASEADPAARQDLKQDIFLALHQSAARIQAAEMPLKTTVALRKLPEN
jgi:RNA polymerase sigma-70 factor (ECF subfamily)